MQTIRANASSISFNTVSAAKLIALVIARMASGLLQPNLSAMRPAISPPMPPPNDMSTILMDAISALPPIVLIIGTA